ncbi:MAG TPA: SUF system NifU family Fe-S cluster assembly protein [Aquabacterium sp.]|nr:SUF system NifU family Fe-S cluster assembly protein [Aquabacterium sp.]
MNAQDDLYQELVLEHKRAPRHFGELRDATHHARGHNPQCGDDISVALRVADGRIQDIRFNGQGCAICMASASMMTEAVLGISTDEAQQLQHRFRDVLMGQQAPEAAYLGKLISLAGVRHYPNRIKCALLAWHALAYALLPKPNADANAQDEGTT